MAAAGGAQPATLWFGEVEPWMTDDFIGGAFSRSNFAIKAVKRITNRATKYVAQCEARCFGGGWSVIPVRSRSENMLSRGFWGACMFLFVASLLWRSTSAAYCFVEFANSSTAEQALATLNGRPIPGTQSPVGFFCVFCN